MKLMLTAATHSFRYCYVVESGGTMNHKKKGRCIGRLSKPSLTGTVHSLRPHILSFLSG